VLRCVEIVDSRRLALGDGRIDAHDSRRGFSGCQYLRFYITHIVFPSVLNFRAMLSMRYLNVVRISLAPYPMGHILMVSMGPGHRFRIPASRCHRALHWLKAMQFAVLSLIPATSYLLTLEPYFECNCPGEILQPSRISAFRGEFECRLERFSCDELVINQP
jgi:hypothetical protein